MVNKEEELKKPVEGEQEEEKPVEDKPQPEESPKPAASPAATAAAEPKKGSNVGLIVAIVILLVAILGVGGYFGGKYLLKKYVNKVVPTVTSTVTAVSTSKTATKTATATSSANASTDYILPDTNARVISESELIGLTPWQLKVARNEIYARHGREFVHKDLQCYFAKKSWYGIDPLYSESALSTTENRNVAIILAYEEKTNSPLLQTDSGCDTNS